MEIELTEAQILRLEDGDVLMFRPRVYVTDAGLTRLKASIDDLVEKIARQTGKRIMAGVMDSDLDVTVVRHA